MIKQFFCKCCNQKQFSFVLPKFLRSKIYNEQYEVKFKKKCNKCNQNNIYIKKLSSKTYELRWKELSDIEERSIELEKDIKNIETNLRNRKKNSQLTKQEEKWFLEKINKLKDKNKKELDSVKKNYRAKIAIKLRYQNNA